MSSNHIFHITPEGVLYLPVQSRFRDLRGADLCHGLALHKAILQMW